MGAPVLVTVVGAALVAASLPGVPEAPGAPSARGSACDGVAVVVDGAALDAGPLGSVSSLGCASVSPKDTEVTARDALLAAGLELTGTTQWGSAFVCRVDGRPALDEQVRRADGGTGSETCERTPAQGASWALWTSTDGSTWVYADRGVVDLEVGAGDVVGLSFVTTAEPAAPEVSPGDALAGRTPQGWAEAGSDDTASAEGSAPAKGSTPDDASGPGEAPASSGTATSVVPLVGAALATALLVAAVVRGRARRS